jgi:hypothetical protein
MIFFVKMGGGIFGPGGYSRTSPPPGWIKFKFAVVGGWGTSAPFAISGKKVHHFTNFGEGSAPFAILGEESAPFYQFGEGKCTFPLFGEEKCTIGKFGEGKFIGLA